MKNKTYININIAYAEHFSDVPHKYCSGCDQIYLGIRRVCDDCGKKLKRIVVPKIIKVRLV